MPPGKVCQQALSLDDERFTTLKPMIYPALPHYGVGGMTGFNFAVNGYMTFRDGAVPNIMIAFAMTFKITTVRPQYFPYFFLIVSHYKLICSRRSERKHMESVSPRRPFKARSSGAAKRTRSISASSEPDSRTNPGMFSLVATHTAACSSHKKFTRYSGI
jgi:hypothetical protein